MPRVVSLVVAVLVVCACLSPAPAGKAKEPMPVLEQNLDADGNIKVHEQGTVSVEGTVTVNDLASVLAKLDNVLVQLQATLNVQGTVNVGNLPEVQQVVGNVNVAAMPAMQIAQPAGSPVPVMVEGGPAIEAVEIIGPVDADGNLRMVQAPAPPTVWDRVEVCRDLTTWHGETWTPGWSDWSAYKEALFVMQMNRGERRWNCGDPKVKVSFECQRHPEDPVLSGGDLQVNWNYFTPPPPDYLPTEFTGVGSYTGMQKFPITKLKITHVPGGNYPDCPPGDAPVTVTMIAYFARR